MVELRHLRDHRHARRYRPGRQPGRRWQFFAIFADGHGRQLPKLTGGPFRYKTYAADTLKKSIRFATKPMKQAVIAPSMLALFYPLKEEVAGYSQDEFEEDLIDECEKDIRQAFAAGAARVSVDFTEGRLATRADPRNPWTGAGMLPHFIELNNRVMARFTADERGNIGVHTCPGGDRDSVHSADVPYNNLLPEMFKINAGYFLIQLASERDKDPVYESIGQHSRDDADGVAQMCFVGVINPETRVSRARRRSATRWSARPTSSRRSGWARRTTAASHRSASTRSRTTARPTTPARWRSRRSPTGWRARAGGRAARHLLTDGGVRPGAAKRSPAAPGLLRVTSSVAPGQGSDRHPLGEAALGDPSGRLVCRDVLGISALEDQRHGLAHERGSRSNVGAASGGSRRWPAM